MNAPDHPEDFAQFLRDREHAGVSRDALRAIYPYQLWPPEWADASDHHEEDDS